MAPDLDAPAPELVPAAAPPWPAADPSPLPAAVAATLPAPLPPVSLPEAPLAAPDPEAAPDVAWEAVAEI